MINVIFEANCLYYKNAEVSVSCEEDLLNICITGDSRNVYLTPSQAKAMSLAVMRCLCFDPIPDPTELVRAVARAPDPLTELERRVVETAAAWRKSAWGNSEYIKARERSIDATDALIAFREDQNPKSPIEELRAAIEDLRADPGEEAYQRVQDALKKVEGK